MIRHITCIECPKGCTLRVEYEEGRVTLIEGNECPRGETYAVAEIENPLRVITSTVAAHGLALRMVPVRTDKPIPKDKVAQAIQAIRHIRVLEPVKTGSIIKENFLELGVNLIATRAVLKYQDI